MDRSLSLAELRVAAYAANAAHVTDLANDPIYRAVVERETEKNRRAARRVLAAARREV